MTMLWAIRQIKYIAGYRLQKIALAEGCVNNTTYLEWRND